MSTVWFFFFNDTATTEIYTLSLHDALPIYFASFSCSYSLPQIIRSSEVRPIFDFASSAPPGASAANTADTDRRPCARRSEEHTSELQSRQYLVCRLLLEKKKKHLTPLVSPS